MLLFLRSPQPSYTRALTHTLAHARCILIGAQQMLCSAIGQKFHFSLGTLAPHTPLLSHTTIIPLHLFPVWEKSVSQSAEETERSDAVHLTKTLHVFLIYPGENKIRIEELEEKNCN